MKKLFILAVLGFSGVAIGIHEYPGCLDDKGSCIPLGRNETCKKGSECTRSVGPVMHRIGMVKKPASSQVPYGYPESKPVKRELNSDGTCIPITVSAGNNMDCESIMPEGDLKSVTCINPKTKKITTKNIEFGRPVYSSCGPSLISDYDQYCDTGTCAISYETGNIDQNIPDSYSYGIRYVGRPF